jgi:hypothetical protein
MSSFDDISENLAASICVVITQEQKQDQLQMTKVPNTTKPNLMRK